MPLTAVCVLAGGSPYAFNDLRNYEHVWFKGEYHPERRGEHFVAPEWREQDGRYRFNEGRWEKDNKG